MFPISPSPGRHRIRGYRLPRRALIAASAGVLATVTLAAAAIAAASAPQADTPPPQRQSTAQSRPAPAAPTQRSPTISAPVIDEPVGATARPAPAVTTGDCPRPATASPTVRTSDVSLPTKVTGYGQEADTDALPMAIAARPDGGSWLAWLGTDGNVYLGSLGCDDKLVGTPTSFPGIDLQDVIADSTGGVVLLTRRGTCGDGPLCGGTSSPCNTMHMIRFDTTGRQVWEQQVTNLTDTRTGYDDGARFAWWYQHHGRLATDGSTYAAYFGVSITVANGRCVDIHQGDRMQVVDAKGSVVPTHRDSFDYGCSHSWTPRMVWDPRTTRYVMVCATDNSCRIAQPHPYRTIASGTCDQTLFGGDVVLSTTPGYWTAWSQSGKVRLDHFTTGASDTTAATPAQSSHPHLASYGTGRMLLAWQSGASMLAQVYDAGAGASVGNAFSIDARDHDYQALKTYPDGSVAFPTATANNTSIRIARILPLGT